MSDEGDSSDQSLCKCPDCSKHHLLLPKKLCKCYGNEVYDPDATVDAAADYEVYGEDSNADQAGSSKAQSAKSRFNMWAYIIGGSGVALLIGALIMRKRVSQGILCYLIYTALAFLTDTALLVFTAN